MKKFIIVIFSLIFLVGCKNSTDEFDYFKVGQNYLESYEYDEAITQFQAGITQDSSDEKNYLAVAEIYSKKGDIDKSVEILLQGFESTASIVISNSLGQIYLKKGEFEESMKWFDISLLKDPTDKDSIKGKIKILSLQNDSEGLVNYLSQLKTENFDSELFIMKGILSIEDINESSRLILQSNTVDDENTNLAVELRLALTAYENANTVHNLSEIIYILLNYGWYEIAQTPLNSVLNDNPFYETTYLYQGLIHLNTSQYDKAIESFVKVRELNPDNIDAYIFQAQVLSIKKQENEVLALIEELLAKETLQLTSSQYSTIQQIYYDLGKFNEIETLYTKYSEIIDIPENVLISYIEVLIRQEKFNQADLTISKLNENNNLSSAEKAKLKALQAIASYKLDRKQQGLDEIEEAESIDNTIAIIHYYKGVIMKDLGRNSEAEIAFERSIELDLQGNVTKLIQE